MYSSKPRTTRVNLDLTQLITLIKKPLMDEKIFAIAESDTVFAKGSWSQRKYFPILCTLRNSNKNDRALSRVKYWPF